MDLSVKHAHEFNNAYSFYVAMFFLGPDSRGPGSEFKWARTYHLLFKECCEDLSCISEGRWGEIL
jgi:hypothetical protein